MTKPTNNKPAPKISVANENLGARTFNDSAHGKSSVKAASVGGPIRIISQGGKGSGGEKK